MHSFQLVCLLKKHLAVPHLRPDGQKLGPEAVRRLLCMLRGWRDDKGQVACSTLAQCHHLLVDANGSGRSRTGILACQDMLVPVSAVLAHVQAIQDCLLCPGQILSENCKLFLSLHRVEA